MMGLQRVLEGITVWLPWKAYPIPPYGFELNTNQKPALAAHLDAGWNPLAVQQNIHCGTAVEPAIAVIAIEANIGAAALHIGN